MARWQLISLPSTGPADVFQEEKGISTATPTSPDKQIFLRDDGLRAGQHLAVCSAQDPGSSGPGRFTTLSRPASERGHPKSDRARSFDHRDSDYRLAMLSMVSMACYPWQCLADAVTGQEISDNGRSVHHECAVLAQRHDAATGPSLPHTARRRQLLPPARSWERAGPDEL